jgi:cold shock protein
MATGKVKKFDEKKGYGFIEVDMGDGNTRDIFAHYSDIEGDGFKTLIPGESVELEIIEGEKGLKAAKIRRVA